MFSCVALLHLKLRLRFFTSSCALRAASCQALERSVALVSAAASEVAHSLEPREVPYRVGALRRRTPAIVEVLLDPLAPALAYLPGQYVLLEDREHTVQQRSYSIANAPRNDRSISLLVTRVAGGQASEWVHNRLRVGEEAILTGPYGTFVAETQSRCPRLYLAGGSGLAPMRALIEAALAAADSRTHTLLFSARTEADVIDAQRFRRWHADHESFRFIRTLTRGEGPDPRGHIPQVLLELCTGLADCEVFIAGAPGFVRACAAASEALGAARSHVHTEPFFVEPQPWSGAPPAPVVED